MKIAFVTYGSINEHATLKRATGMAPALAASGAEVYILLEDTSHNRERVQLECPNVMICFHKRGLSAFNERAKKIHYLKTIKPDLVWICGVGLRNWIFPAKEYPAVLGDHAELLSSIESRTFLRRAWDSLNEWAHLFSFNGHICASRYLLELYQKRSRLLGLKRPIHYSPYAFNSELLEGEPKILKQLESKYRDKKNILYMGSFWENYGFWDMLHVFRDLSKERNDFRVLMMGKGPEKEAGIEWIKRHGLSEHVQILGFIPEDELSSYFHLADSFVCPLRDTTQDWARCPSKLFMYLPFKKPIITCPIGEAIEIFGDNGFYYKPGSCAELKEVLQRVLNLQNWEPSVNPRKHDWLARSEAFMKWLKEDSGIVN